MIRAATTTTMTTTEAPKYTTWSTFDGGDQREQQKRKTIKSGYVDIPSFSLSIIMKLIMKVSLLRWKNVKAFVCFKTQT